MSDYKDIWSPDANGKNPLSEEQLLAYVEGRLPERERREIEEMLSNEGMESDGLEGLQSLSVEETKELKNRLHIELHKALGKKRHSRRGITEQRWTWLAIIVILLLATLCYAVMYLAKQPVK